LTAIPTGDAWAHEIKFDGYRMHARIAGGAASLLTRTGLDWSAKYPEVAAPIGALECRQAYVDGELCAVMPDGTTSFAALQGHGDAPADLAYFAFDLLHLDGEDLIGLPLLGRKARLEALLSGAPAEVRFSGHILGNGAQVFEAGAQLGVEGIVSKRVDSPYIPGNRGVWVKTKCLNRQEFVVVGWTDPEGSRPHLGALLLGYYTGDGKLVYTGRVGTRMPDKTLADLRRRLEPLARTSMPLAAAPPRKTPFGSPLVLSRVHWVEPKLVAEVSYLTWTGDGLLRHTVFMGLRPDKPAKRVRREVPR
jgi:DNA ligase D-like protein (predicted ligase)